MSTPNNNINISSFYLSIFSVVPAAVFTMTENWSFRDSFYFTIITLLTIGFGDFTPTETSSKKLEHPINITSMCLEPKKPVEQAMDGTESTSPALFDTVFEFLVSYGLYRVLVLLWKCYSLDYIGHYILDSLQPS